MTYQKALLLRDVAHATGLSKEAAKMKRVATGARDMENGHRRVLGPNFGAGPSGNFSVCRKAGMQACICRSSTVNLMNHECCQFVAFMI
jgi:hypothetical protein